MTIDSYPVQHELSDEILQERFSPERLNSLCNDFLERGTNQNLKEIIGDRKFVVGLIDATSEFADIGKSVETVKFAKAFNRAPSQVYEEYEEYDGTSTFIVAIDVQDKQNIVPAGALRVIKNSDEKPQKSIVDMVVDSQENPWIDEIKSQYFAKGEGYDPEVAWERLCYAKGVDLKPDESHDIATIAVHSGYGAAGALDGVSISLYHSCLRYALGNGMKNLVSIQDIKPLSLLQDYGNPFDTFEGLEPHPYGGPYDTIPAYCFLEEGMQRIRDKDEFIGQVFIDGAGLSNDFVLFNEYLPGQYSNSAVGLPETQ